MKYGLASPGRDIRLSCAISGMLWVWAFGVVLFGGAGVSAANPPGARGTETTRVSTELARMRADLRQVIEAQRILAAHIEDINARLSAVRRDVRNLQGETAGGGAQQRESIASLNRRIDALQQALAAEQKARQAADQEIVRLISSGLSRGATTSGAAASGASEARGTYTVKRGDTLSAIAQAFDVSVNDLKQINNLTGDLIREGQKLLIPRE